MDPKVEYLVVDTTAFIRESQLQNLGQNIITVQDAVDEIISKRQLRRLVVLPYNLIIKEVFPENIAFISEFAKKTGDYASLSATDIKVMALTYQLEKEKIGTQHLNNEPVTQRLINITTNQKKAVNISHDPDHKEACDNEDTHIPESAKQTSQIDHTLCTSSDAAVLPNLESDLNTKLTIDCNNTTKQITEEDILVPCQEATSDQSGTEDSSDEDAWITPNNVEDVKKKLLSGAYFDDTEKVVVACITLDFAMQNVLKQIGLQVTTLDGKLIRQLRTFIFRCTTCFKTTSVMTKRFCPKCGHDTLRRVAVSIDENGQQVLHINAKKPLTSRGKRYSLPTPKGGQHAQYPLLTEDQPVHNRHVTKLARAKTNLLDGDYIAGYSPFAVRDVNSKSAVLGVRNNQDFKHWMKKNPNESKRRMK